MAVTNILESHCPSGKDEKEIEEFMNKYKTLVDQIKSSVLPIALKCSRFNNLALPKIIFTTQDYPKLVLN